MSEKDIFAIRRDDGRYPPLLRAIPDAPSILYCRGSVEALGHALPLGVVGTRAVSRYGQTVEGMLIGPLARAGFAIVSGLALGADAVAHALTLEAGGTTIAVLAGGVDPASVGPRSNARLAENIVASGGLLISEHPPGTENLKHHFPLRNRIIAGLCLGTLVVEAPVKSGSLITARAALDYNRDVFAVPGPITYPSCAGSNALIGQGAVPICSPADLMAYYGVTGPVRLPSAPPDGLAAALLERLDTPQDVDALAFATGNAASDIIGALTVLELDGLATRTDRGWTRHPLE